MFWVVGKVKTSDTLSQIYSSLWKPWSYLTGSSGAKPAGTDDPDATAQKSSIEGFYFKLQFWQICGNINTLVFITRTIFTFLRVFFFSANTSSTGSPEDGGDVLPSNWTGLVDLEEETPPNADACKWDFQLF